MRFVPLLAALALACCGCNRNDRQFRAVVDKALRGEWEPNS